MEEWQKILITAVSSFAVGIVLEPVRTAINTAIKAKKLRRVLYIELASVYKHLASAQEDGHTPPRQPHKLNSFRAASFPIFKYAQTMPDVFYSLPDAVSFAEFYKSYDVCVSPLVSDDNVLYWMRRLQLHLDRMLELGEFNDDIFREAYPEYASLGVNVAHDPITGASLST